MPATPAGIFSAIGPVTGGHTRVETKTVVVASTANYGTKLKLFSEPAKYISVDSVYMGTNKRYNIGITVQCCSRVCLDSW